MDSKYAIITSIMGTLPHTHHMDSHIDTQYTISLIQSGMYDLNLRCPSHRFPTALMLACEMNLLEIVKELIKSPEIDINIQDDNEETALMYACVNGYQDIAVELLRTGRVNLNIANRMGQTAVTMATDYKLTDVLAELK